MTGDSHDKAVQLAHARIFGLGLTGPPCETWTAARHLQGDDLPHRAPRPWRSCDQAWGLTELTESLLMLRSLHLELLISLSGGGSVMKHRSIPDDPSHASICRTFHHHRNVVMKALYAQMVYIEQWRYGAMSLKPTVLRGLGLPGVAKQLHLCEVPDLKRPTATLSGFDNIVQYRRRTSPT